MPDFPGSYNKEKILSEEMLKQGIREKDILEKFVKSSGPGGQNVNKNSTCVYLKHIPTGIEVKCQKERFQGLNRYLARQLLVKKIKALILSKTLKERQRQEKVKRQKRKKPYRLRLKILEEKRKHSLKKSLRVKVHSIE